MRLRFSGRALPGPVATLVLSSLLLMGISECATSDEDGDGWTVDDGDCDDSDSTVHPGAAELCNDTDDDCDGSTDEGYDSECNSVAAFTGPADDAPGGMRIMDPDGYLYYFSYYYALRVPPGGGIAEVLFSAGQTGTYDYFDNAYVLDDGRVIFDTGANGIYTYDPVTGALEQYAAVTSPNGFGWTTLVDAEGNVLAGYARKVFHPDGSSDDATFLNIYMVMDDSWVYTLQSNTTIYRTSHTGDSLTTYATGITDGYGLALATDGSMWVGQGNSNPSKIFRVPPGGGTAEVVTTVPITVFAVVADTDGYVYVSGVGSNDLYRIDPDTGTATVYGCDPYNCDWK